MTECEADLVEQLSLLGTLTFSKNHDHAFISSLKNRLEHAAGIYSVESVRFGNLSRERLAAIAWQYRDRLPARLVMMAALKGGIPS